MITRRTLVAATAAALPTVPLLLPHAAAASSPAAEPEASSALLPPTKQAVAVGSGGAVSSVNPYASQAGIDVLRRGGNAVDAAIATAAALGVVEPYSCGIGGGGYFVYYNARTKTVHTIDGRETGPARMRPDSFVDPSTGKAIAFTDAVNSGLSVGVPGTPATWQKALDEWGSIRLAEALRTALRLADEGFVVNDQFRAQTSMNEARFRYFTSTTELFLPNGELPVVGSRFRNPDLARS